MQNNIQLFDTSNFNAYLQTDEHGNEFWSARDLQSPLEYSRWEDFAEVVERAIISCEMHGQNPADHFREEPKMVPIGSGAMREVKDYRLTKYGAYLTAMNGNPRKKPIALAQGYFLARTQQAERMDNKSPKEQLQGQLGMLQFVHKVVRSVFRALSQRWIVENKQLALYGKVAFDYFRLEVGRANRQYSDVVKYFHGDNVFDDLNVRGDIVKMQAEIRNGEVSVQIQLPFKDE